MRNPKQLQINTSMKSNTATSTSHNMIPSARPVGHARTRSSACLAAVALACVLIPAIPAHAVDRTWANTGTNFNAGASWTGGTAPGAADLAVFAGPMATNPVNSADLSIFGLQFSTTDATGYTISSTSGTLTLLSLDYSLNPMPPLRGTALFAANTSGTNTISANLALNPTAIPSFSDFYQAGGGTMIISGNISGTPGGATGLYYDGNGVFVVSGNNTYNSNIYGGTGVGYYGTAAGTSSTTVIARSDNAFGNGFVEINVGGQVQFDTDVAIVNAFKLNGQGVGSTGALRNVAGNTTLFGGIQNANSYNVSIQSDAGTLTLQGNVWNPGGSITIQGNGAVLISGSISGAGAVIKTGSGTLDLSGVNTYTGATTVNAGTLLISGGSLAADSAVTVNSGARIGGNGTIAGSLSLASGAQFVFSLTDTLNATGGVTLDNSFGVASLVNSDGSAVNWAGVADGTYTLINSSSSFENISNWEFANRATGLGGGKEAYFQAGSLQLVVIPEPATWALLAFSLTTVVVLRRRARQE